jgi:hypothetical protein
MSQTPNIRQKAPNLFQKPFELRKATEKRRIIEKNSLPISIIALKGEIYRRGKEKPSG